MPPRALYPLILGPIGSPKFTCPSCTFVRAIARVSLRQRVQYLQNLRRRQHASTFATHRNHSLPNPSTRSASTFASPATVNKPLDISSPVKELYEALDALKTNAAAYVNLSRLQLALRGLEGENGKATVRVAVLGIGEDGRRGVRSLVRLLLADPLGTEGLWERALVKGGGADGRSLLIRFGDETEMSPPSPLIDTILSPSRVLQTHNLEILMSSLRIGSSSSSDANAAQEAILVPALETPTSASGRFSHVTYPVHKTIVLGQGVRSLIDYGRYTGSMSDQDLPDEVVKIVANLPNSGSALEDQEKEIGVLDLNLAEQSLEKFRESLSNSQSYERGWYNSGMPGLSDWLLAGTTLDLSSPLKPAVRHLITSLISSTSEQIDASASESVLSTTTSPISDSARTELLQNLSIWAEKSHTELRDQLDLAFASKHWARLKWWKLFWRVDDVAMISNEILERRWLIDAEKSLIFLAGRVTGVGIVEAPFAPEATVTEVTTIDEVTGNRTGPTLEELQKDDVMALDTGAVSSITERKPWPLHITVTRHHLTQNTIPNLQALAQKLVLQTLSTTSLSAAVSALAYVSVIGTSLAEAGVVAAFGFVLSMKRMQNKWEEAREFWEGEIREEGRVCLKETEEGVRMFVLQEGKNAGEGAEDQSDREIARKTVVRAQEALKGLT